MKMFCEADLMMMPFHTEDFGLVAMEAISAGIPVIVNENVSGNCMLRKCRCFMKLTRL